MGSMSLLEYVAVMAVHFIPVLLVGYSLACSVCMAFVSYSLTEGREDTITVLRGDCSFLKGRRRAY